MYLAESPTKFKELLQTLHGNVGKYIQEKPLTGIPFFEKPVYRHEKIPEEALSLRAKEKANADMKREIIGKEEQAALLLPDDQPMSKSGRSVRGERANFTSLVLGCIEAKFCK